MLNVQNPVFQTYLIAASVMILKMMLQAWVTVRCMIKAKGGFLHPEDLRKTPFNPDPNPDQLKPHPDVERSRGMQRNDLENIPGFLFAGFLFTLTHPAVWLAQMLMYGYVISRLLHAWALGTAKSHETRAMFWSVGSLITIGMSMYTLIFAVRG